VVVVVVMIMVMVTAAAIGYDDAAAQGAAEESGQ
jgi:hypothetical protein